MNSILTINDVAADMYEKSRVPITRQCTKIAELKTTADYSSRFKIPNTAHNRKLLGDSLELQSTDKGVYRKIPANYNSSGTIFYGFVVVQGSNEKDIDVEFYGGNLNFFKLIDGKMLSDIDFSELNHQFSATKVYGSRENKWSNGYIYPFLNTSALASGVNLVAPITVFDYMIPMLFVKYIFKRIFEDAGFTLVGEDVGDEMFENLIVDCLTNYSDPNYVKCKAARYSNTATVALQSFHLRIPATADTIISDPSGYISSASFAPPLNPFDGLEFKPPLVVTSGRYDMKFTVVPFIDPDGAEEWSIANGSTFEVGIKDFCTHDGNVYQLIQDLPASLYTMPPSEVGNTAPLYWRKMISGVIIMVGNTPVMYHQYNNKVEPVTIEVNNVFSASSASVYARIVCEPFQTGILGDVVPRVGVGAGTIIECVDAKDTPVIDGSYVNFTGQLHELSQTEFIKEIAQMMGMVFSTDATSNTVKMYLYKNRYKRQAGCYDWSSKQLDGGNIKYKNSSFGQRNLFKWTANDETDAELLQIPEDYCWGEFDVDDDSLSAEKTIVESKFSPCSSIMVGWNAEGRRLPHILKYEGLISTDASWRKMNPRILLLKKINGSEDVALRSIATGAGVDLFTYTDNHPYCHFYSPEESEDLSWNSLLKRNYSIYIKMAQNYKSIDLPLYLYPQDVNEFDFEKLVHINSLQSYFEVAKIGSFVDGTPTIVQLIKIN